MKIAARELNLLGLTLAVVLLALTYLALEPMFQEWADFRAQREDLLARQAAAQQLLDSRDAVEAELEEFRQGLPGRADSQLIVVALDHHGPVSDKHADHFHHRHGVSTVAHQIA